MTWMPTFHQHTFVSETTRDVSWTTSIFVNRCTIAQLELFLTVVKQPSFSYLVTGLTGYKGKVDFPVVNT